MLISSQREKEKSYRFLFLLTFISTGQVRVKVLMACRRLSVRTDQPRKCVSVVWRSRQKHCRYFYARHLKNFHEKKIDSHVLTCGFNLTISPVKTLSVASAAGPC